MEPLSLYIHIPFCRTKCPYCDFNTYANIEHMIDRYIIALKNELIYWSKYLDITNKNKCIKTIFFGGGTPSYIPEQYIKDVMDLIKNQFDLEEDLEVSLECNPNDLLSNKLIKWRESSINRLSIGAQSFSDKFLRVLGRDHDFNEISEGFSLARSLGFDNLSLDLIYGIPGQKLSDWKATINQSLDLNPDHISMYGLTIEKNTKFDWMVNEGLMPEPDSDIAADMYEYVEEIMCDKGYIHYEISNWSLPQKESQHNLTYWYSRPYLGIGAGAHSYFQGLRFWNVNSPAEYINLLEDTNILTTDSNLQVKSGFCAVSDIEPYDFDTNISDTFILGLRLIDGINKSKFPSNFFSMITKHYYEEINGLINIGLLDLSKTSIRLTKRGRLLANEVFYKLLKDT